MKYTEPGEYTLIYKAVDECGNESEQIREITVEDTETYATVLYTDGTFIVNEKSTDREANIQAHGAVTNEYAPLDSTNNYVFSTGSERAWNNRQTYIRAVEFGSPVTPTSLAYWFNGCQNLTSLSWANFNGSEVTSARAFVSTSKLTGIAFPEMPKLTSIQYVCQSCSLLTQADFSYVNSNVLTNTQDAFQGCYALRTVDLTGLAGTVTSADRTFANLSGGGDMALQTVYTTDDLVFTAGANIFRSCVSIVGGNGTTFDSSHTDYTYARIDRAGQPGYFTAG